MHRHRICRPLLSIAGLLGACLLGLGMISGCTPTSEGEVAVYCRLDEEYAYPIVDAFERSVDYETSVVADFDYASESSASGGAVGSSDVDSPSVGVPTDGLFQLIRAEQAAPQCDVFWDNGILQTVRLQKLGLLQPHDWQVPADWPADLVASDGTWCGFAATARVLIVNTDLIPDSVQYPSSVQDLADPTWKDRCAMSQPQYGSTATHWAVLREQLGREATLDQLSAIAGNALILPSNKDVARAVSVGRVAWGLTDSSDALIEQELDYPIAVVFPDQKSSQPGTLRIPNTLAIVKNAPDPVAASQFVDFLLTPTMEDRLAMGPTSQIPISKESKFPSAVLPDRAVRWMRVDFEKVADSWDEWSAAVVISR
ncbi:extracellular solute-binding protein [Allorhodopirellula solitaria]|uniref:Iron uptake protein A1 n=1 Tax=Allorhodopirellula solitaria TaxID=2527987 RepID=A0A5C5Y0F4_9BACT|nr:extracellular solute-binding protein [Allorhodopirellula solitaria]TWT67122.1 Iron uptake protein A1 precursor [Allorhodopirellula solitaria]